MQQNRDINAFLKSGRCRVSKGALPVNNSKASDKDQYILVRPYDIKTHYTKFI